MHRSLLSRRSLLFVLSAAVCALAHPAFAADPLLAPGSPAPLLDIKAWYKGAPITKLDAKKTYVVEFWATWCGPCIETIPHVTELARKNPDITFLGVSIWEPNDKQKIAKFVTDMGDKMNYTVGWSGEQDGMAQTWMLASMRNGIPTSFIVRNGVIQWIGHPMQMDKVLESIKKGEYDLTKAKETYTKEAEKTRKEIEKNQEFTQIETLYKSGKTAKAKEVLEAFGKKYPGEAQSVDFMKFSWLAKEDPEAWKTLAKSDADSKDPAKLQRLCSFGLRQAAASGNRALGEYALTLAMDATERKSIRPLNYTLSYYEQTKEYAKALPILDSIEKLISSLPKEEQMVWQEIVTKKRKDFQEQVGK
jgi:thiol-disulfide isomerase/thioredoxin